MADIEFPVSGGIVGDALPTTQIDEVLSITADENGDVVIEIGDIEPESDKADSRFDDNLAEAMPSSFLSTIAQDILEGINADEQTRSEWVADYEAGIQMLGLNLDAAAKSASTMGANTSVSKVQHPILLQAVVRFQSAAGAELLPSAGPVKVSNPINETEASNARAMGLQEDFNFYLTAVATEYYPDMARGLFYLGYGGTIFKKVYHCPVRRRPVSDCVYLPDLIISNDAQDIQTAMRVTQRTKLTPSQMARLQIAGVYRDVQLSSPMESASAIDKAVAGSQGIAAATQRPSDQRYTVYETYTDLDPVEYGLDEKGCPEGLPLPYRVVIEKDSQQVLSIHRDWKEGDDQYRRRKTFVKYGLIPGLGFYDIGYLHLIGQQAKALTAIRRILIDAGMFANFPGGVKVKGTRQSTNQIAPMPGSWVEIDTGPQQRIQDVLMPLPYKEPSAVLLQLAESIEEDTKSLAGSVEMEVGEGRTNIPVGTMMALVEQQTQIMSAVHKRLHVAQQEEFILLKEKFMEDPAALTAGQPKPERTWTAEEIDDADLVPASDPNVPAQVHRIQQASFIAMRAAQAPELYDPIAVERRLMTMVGVSDIDTLLKMPTPGGSPQANAPQDGQAAVPPEILAADVKVKADEVQARAMGDAEQRQIDQRKAQVDAMLEYQRMQLEAEQKELDRQSRERIAAEREATQRMKLGLDAAQPAGMNGDAYVP